MNSSDLIRKRERKNVKIRTRNMRLERNTGKTVFRGRQVYSGRRGDSKKVDVGHVP